MGAWAGLRTRGGTKHYLSGPRRLVWSRQSCPQDGQVGGWEVLGYYAAVTTAHDPRWWVTFGHSLRIGRTLSTSAT